MSLLPGDDFWGEERKRLFQVLFPHMLTAADEAAQKAIDDLPEGVQIGVDYDLVNQAVADWAEGYTFDLIKDIDKTTQDRVRDKVTAWINDGGTIKDLATELEVWFDENRAKAIAVTEVTRAFAEGNITAWKQTGVVSQYQFLTAGDNDVDDECRTTEAQGPYPIEDTEHLPPLHVNCRCYIQPVLAGFEEDLVETGTNYDLDSDIQAKLREYMKENADKIEQVKNKGVAPEAIAERAEAYRKIGEMSDQIDGLIDQSLTMERHTPEWDAIRKQIYDLQKERQALYDRASQLDGVVRKDAREQRDNLLKLFGADKPGDAKLEIIPSIESAFNPFIAEKAASATEFLNGLLNGEQILKDAATIVKTPQSRAFFDGSLLNLNFKSDVGVVLHEFGHALEKFNKGWQAAAFEFLEARTAGSELKKMIDLFPGMGYMPTETVKPDDFFHPYIGSQYFSPNGDRRATEIISMGLEALYRDPAKFATQDPEHFAFIMSLLSGAL